MGCLFKSLLSRISKTLWCWHRTSSTQILQEEEKGQGDTHTCLLMDGWSLPDVRLQFWQRSTVRSQFWQRSTLDRDSGKYPLLDCYSSKDPLLDLNLGKDPLLDPRSNKDQQSNLARSETWLRWIKNWRSSGVHPWDPSKWSYDHMDHTTHVGSTINSNSFIYLFYFSRIVNKVH